MLVQGVAATRHCPSGYACQFAVLAPAILQQEKCNPTVICGNLVPVPQTIGFIAHWTESCCCVCAYSLEVPRDHSGDRVHPQELGCIPRATQELGCIPGVTGEPRCIPGATRELGYMLVLSKSHLVEMRLSSLRLGIEHYHRSSSLSSLT